MRPAPDDAPSNPPARTRLERLVPALVAALLVVGYALRLRAWSSGRSLWADEAMLALGIARRTLGTLLSDLPYDQAAPTGFVLLVRLVTLVAGTSERALRGVSLVAGLVSLPLFASVARRLLSRPAALLALAVFVVAEPLVAYGNELKPYALDVAIALAILRAGLGALDRAPSARRGAAYAVTGAVFVWLSYPAIFVLAGTAIVLGGRAVHRRDSLGARRVAGLATACALSFGAAYLLAERSASTRAYLLDFWRLHRAPWPISSSAVAWYVEAYLEVFHDPAGFVTSALAAAAAIVGLHVLGRRSLSVVGLLVVPVLVTLLASRLVGYPFSSRLILFLAPTAILLAVAGLDELRRIPGRPVWFVVAAALLLLHPVVAAVSTAATPTRREEIRPVLERLLPRVRPGDGTYVYAYGRPQVDWYATQGLALPDGTTPVRGAVLRADVAPDGGPARFSAPLLLDDALRAAPARVWAIFTHVVTWKGRDEERLARDAFERAGYAIDEAASAGLLERGASATLYVR